MNFTTRPLLIARIYDMYGEVLGYTTHSNAATLESIVRSDWEGSDHATEFRIVDQNGNELVNDLI